MRKKVLTLKEARPAIKNLIKSMKRKYDGSGVVFERITTISDIDIEKNMPSKAKAYLAKNPNVRRVGHENGIEFYYYKLKLDNNNDLFILPIIVMAITRSNNDGEPSMRLLVCSLDTFLPKINEDKEIDLLLSEVYKN